MSQTDPSGESIADADLVIVGAGVAGRSAGIFTARAGIETLLIHGGNPILRRNAHLENYPGFPAGVNARLLLDLMRDQAERAGCQFRDGRAVDIAVTGDGFEIELDDSATLRAERVIAASWSDASYLDGLDVELEQRGSKRFVMTDQHGRTHVDGLYAAGRIAGLPHQSVVNAGHGAQVGLTVIEDSDVPFYHDWVVPEDYFTGRDRDVPPGCEEIDAEEFRRREEEALTVMREAFEAPHPDEPKQHPSVAEDSE